MKHSLAKLISEACGTWARVGKARLSPRMAGQAVAPGAGAWHHPAWLQDGDTQPQHRFSKRVKKSEKPCEHSWEI